MPNTSIMKIIFMKIIIIMEVLGMTIEPNYFCAEADTRCIKFFRTIAEWRCKEARLSLKSARKEEEEENVNLEDQLYGAGIAV